MERVNDRFSENPEERSPVPRLSDEEEERRDDSGELSNKPSRNSASSTASSIDARLSLADARKSLNNLNESIDPSKGNLSQEK